MKKHIRSFFFIYALIMLWLLFGQRLGQLSFTGYADKISQNINLIPFTTVRLFLRLAKFSIDSRSVALAVRNLFGNVVLFMPLGVLPMIYPRLKGFGSFILTVAVTITAVELLQLFTLLGSCDIDDLILNLWGASLGYLLVRSFCRDSFL